ncbi:hypothetical protein [Pseudomonas sp. JUb52]|uniref:hypothetical protein n=1 Tax=Pseudomonas sp. JUb52 TaxID=2485127 RepID=UPI0010438465|nr:hypothetical protein [Pseudomonas sp. JUb52]TCQ83899.1 hypothetical protein EC839_1149 [Pseudomonas sp. JUb52]
MSRRHFDSTNVSQFRGFDVVGGEVTLSDSEYREYLDEAHEDVQVAGMTFSAGDILESCDPVAFRCMKGDYESGLQSELEQQLADEDSDGIEFVEDLESDDEDEE